MGFIVAVQGSLPVFSLELQIRDLQSFLRGCLVLSRAGVGKLFLQDSHSKYFRLCWPDGVCCNYSALLLQHKSSRRQLLIECLWLCSNKTLLAKIGSGVDLAQWLQCASLLPIGIYIWFLEGCEQDRGRGSHSSVYRPMINSLVFSWPFMMSYAWVLSWCSSVSLENKLLPPQW